ncbi:MAG: DegT/DnrJ/EryC1/StrS family aminotransferase [Longimicrobiaceae bacterium]
MTGREQQFVAEAFASNWIAPLGPFVTRFEDEFAERVGVGYALAVSSGTAGLHLALKEAEVGPGDEVLVSTFTFAASVNPILYLGARPVFIDSETESWNMDPALLEDTFVRRAAAGRLPKALVLVHLYGQCADLDAIAGLCDRYGVALIEDAAEALGATYRGRSPGGFGLAGVFSFNGNKIITTSGGGMLVSDDGDLIRHARKLATQARDPAPHYQHSEIGYNYRLSNILAAIGVSQLEVLEDRVEARRLNFDYYRAALAELPGIEFMPESPWGRHTRWLTCLTVDPAEFGANRETLRLTLEARGIESRPLWKPMHLQPAYARYESVGGAVSETIFKRGLCLPSGSSLTAGELDRVIDVFHDTVVRKRIIPVPELVLTAASHV